jgi:hypothetical protein
VNTSLGAREADAARQEPDRAAIGASPIRRNTCENRRFPMQRSGRRPARCSADTDRRPAHRGDHRLLGGVQRAQELVAAPLHLLAFGTQSAALHAPDIGAGENARPSPVTMIARTFS